MEKENKRSRQPQVRKNITIYDIAREAGVSTSMVSRVITGNGVVSEKNRIMVQEIVDKYKFKPNAIARGLQKSQTGLIGFVIPFVGNEYFSSVYYEFEKLASEKGYMIILNNGKNDHKLESRILGILEETRVEAVIIMGGRIDWIGIPDELKEEIRTLNETIPCILCSEQADEFGCIGVHSDDRLGCQLAIRYIAENGYTTMGIFGGAGSSYPSYNKKKYLMEEAAKHNIQIKKEWIHGNSFDEVDGAESMRKLLQTGELPEIVFCINDHVAFGAQCEAQDAGLKVPQDIKFIGADGVRVSAMARPPITTVAIDFKQYARTLFDAMTAAMEGREFPTISRIPPTLIERGSTIRSDG
ncbi:DNA-binding LacI/PurR family transcriptional regulator [Anaerotaenia torta]|uniref:LacI family DNA-binding transcriptional regulator n=1 Tax=Anaerotaenia torta TaxID=433293 RepID=UPI003D1AE2E1